MKSFISHFTLLRIFLSMDSFMILLYILKNFFKNNAHLYTRTFQFITWIFNPSSHTKKIQWTRHGNQILLHIVLKPGQVRPNGSTQDPADPRLEPGQVEEKIEEGKTRRDPVDPTGWPGQKSGCNPLTFVFLLKRCRFDFFKKRIDPVKTWNPGFRPGHVWNLCFYKSLWINTTKTWGLLMNPNKMDLNPSSNRPKKHFL